jgi:hypothetical protein
MTSQAEIDLHCDKVTPMSSTMDEMERGVISQPEKKLAGKSIFGAKKRTDLSIICECTH